MTFDQMISLITLVFAVVGGVFALMQWVNMNKIKRAEFINQIIEKLRFDKEMVETMYMIDYDLTWYNQDFHGTESELEYKVDKILSYLSYICYLESTGNIKKREFGVFKYELNRTCKSPCVQNYLWNIYHFSIENESLCPFEYLINFGFDEKIIDKEFLNKFSNNFKKYLNF